jgi:hypothetical protein
MAMKWIPLDGKKEPEFHKECLVINKSGGWNKAWIKEITQTHNGKSYTFSAEEIPDILDATHFMYIEPPKI